MDRLLLQRSFAAAPGASLAARGMEAPAGAAIHEHHANDATQPAASFAASCSFFHPVEAAAAVVEEDEDSLPFAPLCDAFSSPPSSPRTLLNSSRCLSFGIETPCSDNAKRGRQQQQQQQQQQPAVPNGAVGRALFGKSEPAAAADGAGLNFADFDDGAFLASLAAAAPALFGPDALLAAVTPSSPFAPRAGAGANPFAWKPAAASPAALARQPDAMDTDGAAAPAPPLNWSLLSLAAKPTPTLDRQPVGPAEEGSIAAAAARKKRSRLSQLLAVADEPLSGRKPDAAVPASVTEDKDEVQEDGATAQPWNRRAARRLAFSPEDDLNHSLLGHLDQAGGVSGAPPGGADAKLLRAASAPAEMTTPPATPPPAVAAPTSAAEVVELLAPALSVRAPWPAAPAGVSWRWGPDYDLADDVSSSAGGGVACVLTAPRAPWLA